MSVEYFLDTNLFIYQLDSADEAKARIATRIIREGIATGNACISFQVVQECLNTILRKAEISLSTEQAGLYLDASLAPRWRLYCGSTRAFHSTNARLKSRRATDSGSTTA